MAGSGAWRDGRWRALFARDLDPSSPGLAEFSVGEETMVAFAVWDGGSGDRNGQKSIAQFIELRLSDAEVSLPGQGADGDGPSSLWGFALAFVAILGGGVLLAGWAVRSRRA